ncbi:MAG: hypothetical protein K9H64_06070 [Bacteroidales bacterium]|nr:hypothetical protein [Bacteroidales bacterium]MCF8455471.1 hypothetical protein [Bacteroidales bacterium]
METDIQDIKIELIRWLTTLDDTTMLEKVLFLRESEKSDWWSEISNSEKESIEQGLKDANSGKLNPHSEARKLYEKWL